MVRFRLSVKDRRFFGFRGVIDFIFHSTLRL